ncbi:MAG: helix-turn-helix transcriptional regulator [Geodermatophilaceae bacterium]|nr:helix-turn-helix transcriptional regulator [Geodermatophilaceae bacterium]
MRSAAGGNRCRGEPADRADASRERDRDAPRRGPVHRQIAGKLFVSERTVETHVSHVLAKVGGSSRTDIVAWAYSTGVAASRP